ncbi:molybdenum cofactor guanylyltransferase MobA [Pseudomonas syringae pv. tagetis]|uniref:Molybdenum cofactor guanylyltransferase n=2 Tax=Pseudomonas syringae group genomosp. 7 TaxID=251699 RepID=A0A0Q0B014_9PSED|nr:molybdenum cofactor guanylyltransferase MobA [Pseudomonas syringae group genomosp. 7]KPY82851.1 Molybdenum cofactor guanylyltransferase [Pseudomonas syringae pv. tagetis]RMQ99020.1 Molybdenum cofactor guanylyltransferase [Pseudomonas syringae pv. helianthi]RMV52965.1 Molybdenum cofactor guanylyltransferase [Pseudomonas syringae pv. helianthi]RMW13057.1 Molybdenum cofactor guanylyltransferase [Pseudomonas syringae pv. tagetis]RMW15524.1 Molybdenum cofactor guanylyltransferase [Pseudomonas sy
MIVPATLPPCSILLLAGGRGQRMGGRDKGLIEWQGSALIEHLHRLTRPLTDDLIISCNRNIERYAQYADQLVQDHDSEFNGPLAGIRAALPRARHQWLLILPCDVPLVDEPLLQALREKAREHPERPIMVREGQHWQPLLCMIPTAHAATLEAAWQAGERSPRRAMEPLQPVALQLEAGDPRLANLNTPCLLTGISEKP